MDDDSTTADISGTEEYINERAEDIRAANELMKQPWMVEFLGRTAESGQNAIKWAIVTNGGASVALVAFIGRAASSGNVADITWMAAPLVWFAAGVFMGAVGAGSTYVVNCQVYRKIQNEWLPVLSRRHDLIGKDWTWQGLDRVQRLFHRLFGWNALAIAFVAMSYLCFAGGAIHCSVAINGLPGDEAQVSHYPAHEDSGVIIR